MCYFVTQTYLSDLRSLEQRIIIGLIVLGALFYFFAPFMNNMFGLMNRRNVFESYPDAIWKILGVFFTFIGMFLFVINSQ